jgi:uncharacterized protein YidB (DUF937 family)
MRQLENGFKENTMGLLDSVLGSVMGARQGQGGAAAGGGDLLKAVVGMLGNDSANGGLAGLVQQFQRGGLGNVIQSWISTGQNLPVSADQLSNVLGNDTLGALAQKLGLDPGEVAGQLSQVLPQVVDKLTPNGQMPQGGLGNVSDLLGQLLKR